METSLLVRTDKKQGDSGILADNHFRFDTFFGLANLHILKLLTGIF